MKAYKTITVISAILLSIIIVVASFLGIYKLKDFKVKNIVPKYLIGMEFNSNSFMQFKVDDSVESTTVYDAEGNVVEQEEGVEYTEENGYKTVENKANSEDKLTSTNYNLSKNILKNRLEKLGIKQYKIKQDKISGNMQIQISEEDLTDEVKKSLEQVGKFEMTDSETGEVLMDNSYIKNALVASGSTDATGMSTTVYVQIYFNKEGTKKLEEISKTYVATTIQVENNEGELEDKEETKNVNLLFDGEIYRTTYFGQTMTDGVLNLAIGSGEIGEDLEKYAKEASRIAINLNTGVMPVKYTVDEATVQPYIDINCINIAIYVAITILAISFVYLIIKFKLKGLLISVLEIGYIALLLLVIRYTNILVTLEGIIGIGISVILNYIFSFAILNSIVKDKIDVKISIKDVIIKFLINLIPLYVIAIVFTFMSNANISSIGMTLFWGILIMYVYNILVTKTTLEIVAKK